MRWRESRWHLPENKLEELVDEVLLTLRMMKDSVTQRHQRKHTLRWSEEGRRYRALQQRRAEEFSRRLQNYSFSDWYDFVHLEWRNDARHPELSQVFSIFTKQHLHNGANEQARIIVHAANMAERRIRDITDEEQKLQDMYKNPSEYLWSLRSVRQGWRTSVAAMRAQDAVADISTIIEATNLLCARHLDLKLSRYGSRAEIQSGIEKLGHSGLADHLRAAYYAPPVIRFLVGYNNDRKHALGKYSVVPRRKGYCFKHGATYLPVLETVRDMHIYLGQQMPETLKLLLAIRPLEPRYRRASPKL